MNMDTRTVFIDDELPRTSLDPLYVEIDVKAHGVNYSDPMAIQGNGRSTMVLAECAGVVAAVGSASIGFNVGDRVCAWGGSPYASKARVHHNNVYCLQDFIYFSVGASIPLAFMRAYYCVVQLGNLHNGQNILVHGAAKAVGQAALLVAKHLGLATFAVVSSNEEQSDLANVMSLSPTQTLSRQKLCFHQDVFNVTKGRGFDLILDCSSTEDLDEIWPCIASLGTFIQIRESRSFSEGHKNMLSAEKNATFVSFDFATLHSERPDKAATLLSKVMSMFEKDSLQPLLPITLMSINRNEEALQLLQGPKQTGKIVLETGERTVVDTISINYPVVRFEWNATYVIAGGLGDLGQRLC